jgi:hypothetical protein
MRAHTTTNAKTGARRRTKRSLVPGGILALSLAVVLLGGTASTASTTPTPPLTLSLSEWAIAGPVCRTHDRSCPSYWELTSRITRNSKVVLRGDVKRTTVPFGKDPTRSHSRPFNAELKHPEQLRGRRVTVTVKASATEFGQTARDKAKYVLRRCAPSTVNAGAYATGGCDVRR